MVWTETIQRKENKIKYIISIIAIFSSFEYNLINLLLLYYIFSIVNFFDFNESQKLGFKILKFFLKTIK